MSRVGKNPVPIPDGAACELKGSYLKVQGPKGTLESEFHPAISIEQENGELHLKRPSEKPEHRALHGLVRALINNMLEGVTQGFQKRLEIVGVGYRAQMQGNKLQLQVGYSHPIHREPPEGITYAVEGNNVVIVSGIDKQAVGQEAANIRALRKPEPYKGKGIRYAGEEIRRKEGKSGSKK